MWENAGKMRTRTTPNTDTFYPVRVNQIRWLVILIRWQWNNWMSKVNINQSLFFSIKVFFHRHWRFTGQQGKECYHLFIPLYLFHSLTNTETFYLQLCKWDDYHVFSFSINHFYKVKKFQRLTLMLHYI